MMVGNELAIRTLFTMKENGNVLNLKSWGNDWGNLLQSEGEISCSH